MPCVFKQYAELTDYNSLKNKSLKDEYKKPTKITQPRSLEVYCFNNSKNRDTKVVRLNQLCCQH